MRYKVLLTGKNHAAIDDFFTHLSDDFDSVTTSLRYEDINNHLKYFKPDVFVYCMNLETEEEMKRLNAVRVSLKSNNVLFVILGSGEDCDRFSRCVIRGVDLVLVKPISVSSIASRITSLLQGQQSEEINAVLTQEPPTEENVVSRKHILVVDDDPFMLKLIKEHLHEKYDVATATSGKIALKFLEKKQTNLILLDYEMPLEDGPAVLEKLHANENTSNIPVVFLTGITERNKIQKALVQKPQGYLLKPIEREKLLETIEKIIG